MKKTFFKRGFTLIELLVVIAIIGILTSIVMANLFQAKAKSRDAKRISDLAQWSLVLEQAFDRCNAYPPNINALATPIDNTNCSGITIGTFHSTIPKDPSNTNDYDYIVNSDKTNYVLRAVLEGNSSVLSDDVDGQSISSTADYCNDSIAPFNYCIEPK